MLAGCMPIPRSKFRPLMLVRACVPRTCRTTTTSASNSRDETSCTVDPVELEGDWSVAAERSTVVLCRLHSFQATSLDSDTVMGPITMQQQHDVTVRELSIKSSRSSHSSGSCSTSITNGSGGGSTSTSSFRRASRLSSVSTTSSVDSTDQPVCSCPSGANAMENLYKSYTLHVRLLMYARDLFTSMQSSRDVRTSFHDDPVLLPAEYFNRTDREEIMSTRVDQGRCYRDVVEEVLLDKRGHFSCLDILPLVQRTFQLSSEDILSVDLAKLQESFHKDYRTARRQAKAAEEMQQFGEHSV